MSTTNAPSDDHNPWHTTKEKHSFDRDFKKSRRHTDTKRKDANFTVQNKDTSDLNPHSKPSNEKINGRGRKDFTSRRDKNRKITANDSAHNEEKRASEGYIAHKGFSLFQQRLVRSILEDVLVKHIALDKAYAYWFSKVKIDPIEQGFLIKQINYMFSHLSFFAIVSKLKRPSDFERHVGRLLFSFCAYKDFTLPELEGEEGFDRRGLKKRMAQALEDPLLKDGCPTWLETLCKSELKENWPKERAALGSESRRFIRTNTLKITKEELSHLLKTAGIVTRSVAGVNTALEVTSNSALFKTKAFKDGYFEQQDGGSQLIGEFVGAKSGERIVDACAGSGGKTLQLAAAMEGKGVLLALDTEEWKLKDLKKRARRAGAFNIETRLIDSSKTIKRLYESADRVLIDAPCSGSGVLRRTPDSKWRDGREHLNEIRELQKTLLERYTKIAKIGGEVVYSTCSILPSENQQQIASFLENHHDEFVLIEEKQILPSSGFDGFYMAKLKRLA